MGSMRTRSGVPAQGEPGPDEKTMAVTPRHHAGTGWGLQALPCLLGLLRGCAERFWEREPKGKLFGYQVVGTNTASGQQGVACG